MGIEPLKVLKLICTDNNQYDILTRMPEKEIVEEVEYVYDSVEEGPNAKRDWKWLRLEATNPLDEHITVAIIRKSVKGYLIMPFHQAQAQSVSPAERVMPRILQ